MNAERLSERLSIEHKSGLRGVRRVGWIIVLLAAIVMAGVLIPAPTAPAAPAAQSGWPTYLADPARTSASDARIGPFISPAWTHVVSGLIASEPVIANNRVYVTAWDGYLYALDQSDGHEIWRTFLGTYQLKPGCPGSPFLLGITAAPAFDAATNLLYASAMSATVVITSGSPPNRDTGPYLYAIDPANGHIQWEQMLSANNDNYAWSSPLVANDRAYVGVASQGDCPLTQGQLVAVGLTGTHTLQRAAMSPDSLTVYPTNLVAGADPPTSTLLLDGSDYNLTATAAIDYRGPLSASVSIRLRNAQNGNNYQPQLHERHEGQTCEGGLQFLEEAIPRIVATVDDPLLREDLEEAARSATVTAETPLQCWGLTSWAFRPIVQRNASVAWSLLESLAKMLSDR